MNPQIEQLAERLQAAAEQFAAKQRPGVPIDLAAPEAQRIRAMLEEMQQNLQQHLDKETAQFQAELAATRQQQANAAAVPEPTSPEAALAGAGGVTFSFQKRWTPEPEIMHQVVEGLMKLAKE